LCKKEINYIQQKPKKYLIIFLKSLDYQREQGGWTDSKDMMKLASIPVAVVDQMLSEGVDVYKAPVKDIIKWLKNHDCERFLTH